MKAMQLILRWMLPGLLLVLLSPPALADSEWGLSIYDADENFIISHWTEEDSIILGSGEDCELRLEGLQEHHVAITLVGDRMRITAILGSVAIEGVEIWESRLISPQDDLRVGPYVVQALLPVAVGAELESLTESTMDPALDPMGAVRGRAEEFAKKRYAFCHDPDFGKDGTIGADFCVILDEGSQAVCPEAAHCKDWEDLPTKWRFGTAGGKSRSERAIRRVSKSRPLVDLPEIPDFVQYLLLAGIIAVLVGVFASLLAKAGWEKEDLDFADPEISDAARKLQALPEARARTLLRMAAKALDERNDGHEAAVLVHLAILRHLDDEGLARYHPSKTNGDYLRAVRRRKDLVGLLKSVVNLTERIRFGDGHVDIDAVRVALDSASPILAANRAEPKTKSLGGIATLALVVAAGSPLSGCQPTPGTQAYYSGSPVGMGALVPLLRAAGMKTKIHRDRLSDLPDDTSVIVLRTSALGEETWPSDFKLDTQFDLGRTVVIIDDFDKSSELLPSTSAITSSGSIPKATQLRFNIESGLSCAHMLEDMVPGTAEHPAKLPEGRLIAYDGVTETTTITAYPLSMQPFLLDEGRPSVEGRSTAHGWAMHRLDSEQDALPGCLFLFSDRDLFTNASLTRPDNAAFVAGLFASWVAGSGTIVFADRLDQWSMNESDNPFAPDGSAADPTKALKSSNMLPFVLQGLVMLALLYVFLGAAFGPLRDRETQTHKAFVEHVEAIGRQYAHTGKPGLTHSAVSLARFVVMRNRGKVRGGQAGGWSAVATELAEKHDLEEEDVRAALRLGIEGRSDLGAPRLEDPEPSSPRMLETLRRLLSTHRRS